MQGNIESIKPGRDGKFIVRVKTDNESRVLYGLPTNNVPIGTCVEYDIVISKASGKPYAKFISFVKIIGKNAETDSQERSETSSNKSEGVTDSEAVNRKMAADGNLAGISNYGTEDVLNQDDGRMTVTQLNYLIGMELNDIPELKNFWVKGEVTNYSGHSLHYYFDIKDANARISCRLWESTAASALGFNLENGQKIAVRGSLEFYNKAGTCQINVSKILNLGEGDAKLKLEQLKEKLRNEGLFDPEHHKEVPKHAKRVGVVTSGSGQAIRDIMKVWQERNKYVELILYPVNVQGANAVKTTIKGIRYFDKEAVDVIIVGRGGGSDEELMVYNDEQLVRTIFNANTPIVTAVGHAGHFTLVDQVADLYFITPTDAAQHVIFDVMSDINRVDDLLRQITDKMINSIKQRTLKLGKLEAELKKNSPETKLEERKNRLSSVSQQLCFRMNQVFNNKKHRYEVLLANLNGLSPTAKLVRGFGYISSNDKPVVSVKNLMVGDDLLVKIHDGEISATITELKSEGD